jgi:hypothetical protein
MKLLTASELAQALTTAEFDSIVTLTRQHRFVFADVGAYMTWVRAQGIGTIINRLDPRDISRFERACEQRLRNHEASDGYELVKSVDLTVASRPAREP